MEIKRDIQNKKIYVVDKNEVLLETGRIGAEFIISIYKESYYNNKRIR